MRVERQRIEQPRVEPPPQRIDPLEPADRADIHLVLERGEIGTLDQQQPQIPREMRLLGIARVEPAGRQQPDPRVGPLAHRRDPGAEGCKERRMSLDVQPILQPAERAADRDAVLQRIAGAGGCAEVIGEHAPLAGRPPTEIDRDEIEVPAAGRVEPDHRPQEERTAGDERGGDMAVGDQLARAVEVGDHRLHQRRALDHAALDPRPFAGFDQQRDGGDGPGALIGLVGDAEACTDVDRMPLDAFADVAEVVRGDHREFGEHCRPGGVGATVFSGAQHVGAGGARAIVGDPALGMDHRVEKGRGLRRRVQCLKPPNTGGGVSPFDAAVQHKLSRGRYLAAVPSRTRRPRDPKCCFSYPGPPRSRGNSKGANCRFYKSPPRRRPGPNWGTAIMKGIAPLPPPCQLGPGPRRGGYGYGCGEGEWLKDPAAPDPPHPNPPAPAIRRARSTRPHPSRPTVPPSRYPATRSKTPAPPQAPQPEPAPNTASPRSPRAGSAASR
jgi:hypothetical protein